MLIIGLFNALSVKKEYRWQAFIDTCFLDEFSYAHKYARRWK